MCPQPLLEQLYQCIRCLSLPFGRDLLEDGLDGTFDQHTQNRIWVHTQLAGHCNCLSEKDSRIRPTGGNTLGATDVVTIIVAGARFEMTRSSAQPSTFAATEGQAW
jgi:hypothetical protein